MVCTTAVHTADGTTAVILLACCSISSCMWHSYSSIPVYCWNCKLCSNTNISVAFLSNRLASTTAVVDLNTTAVVYILIQLYILLYTTRLHLEVLLCLVYTMDGYYESESCRAFEGLMPLRYGMAVLCSATWTRSYVYCCTAVFISSYSSTGVLPLLLKYMIPNGNMAYARW